ncbi:hypothetical protein OUZ56_016655 [Daphnia magna]|uniref:Uncharacterized protein n=1 Tax=Daphnia magna TaxID=35525 RepID=A0ABR0AR69_9CRUS|nr:hypothetical protein OUZ56_016655 [Daphnia magna]
MACENGGRPSPPTLGENENRSGLLQSPLLSGILSRKARLLLAQCRSTYSATTAFAFIGLALVNPETVVRLVGLEHGQILLSLIGVNRVDGRRVLLVAVKRSFLGGCSVAGWHVRGGGWQAGGGGGRRLRTFSERENGLLERNDSTGRKQFGEKSECIIMARRPLLYTENYTVV